MKNHINGLIHRILNPVRMMRDDDEGVVLAAVLIFISLLLPVTLVILNTIQIETLLPTNEGYGRIAAHEADKGFDMAMAALMADNKDGFFGDYYTDPTRPIPATFPQNIQPTDTYYVPGKARGRHDIDYLAESWARYPENYTYFMAEHSREMEPIDTPELNPDPPEDPDYYSVPTRWIMMNVPFGLDDHSERTINATYNNLSDVKLNMDYKAGVAPVTPIKAFGADVDNTEPIGPQAAPVYVANDWRISASHPNFGAPNYIPRPASYFRNTNPGQAGTSNLYDHGVADSLVYDSAHDDLDGDGALDAPANNQYIDNPPLQEAVNDSQWANIHFGAGAASSANREYKPMPGMITQYPVGSNGEDFIPAWFESICSDESSRFNLNTILNIVFQGGNYDYNSDDADPALPIIQNDDYGLNFNADEVLSNPDHPNYSNAQLARDMIAALLLGDTDVRSAVAYSQTQEKANWILRNMMIVRQRLDGNYDADGDGVADQIDYTYLNYSTTPPSLTTTTTTFSGRGRAGDGPRPNQGSWRIYNNPKDFMNDPGKIGYADFPFYRPINDEDFKALNLNCTVYTYETEHIADAESSGALDDRFGYRSNFNQLDENSNLSQLLFNNVIGLERTRSLYRWRDGLVDLNGDGDLNDEFVLQPVKDPETAELETNIDITSPDNTPVSQITYREHNHYNFQDPKNPMYPAMLNVPDLGTLLMVPMSVRSSQIIASLNGTELHVFDTGGGPSIAIPNTTDGLSSDIDFSGSKLIFDSTNLADINEVDIPKGTTLTAITDRGHHPSYNQDGTQFVFIDNTGGPGGEKTISVYDIPTDTVVRTNLNGAITLAQMDLGVFAADALEPASPDWSPVSNTIAFTGGGMFDLPTAIGDPTTLFDSQTDIYITRTTGPLAGVPDNITNNLPGQYAFYPDWHPNGDQIAYTLLDFNELFRGRPPFKIVILDVVRNTKTDVIPTTANLLPFAPDWDPYGNNLCFMGFGAGNIDIYTISKSGTSAEQNITNSPDVEFFPTWGWGPTRVAYQNDHDPGSMRGHAVAYPPLGVNPDGDPWDDTYQKELAAILQNASLAFRENDPDNLGNPQNWRYMDFPVIPQLMTDPLAMIADAVAFRPVYAPRLTSDQPNQVYPQAYPGKVNINTASPRVLRALFLLMFQGSVYDWNDGTGIHSSAPMARTGGSTAAPIPINLAYAPTTIELRRYALLLADQYAHQVDEYRRWVYNNQSKSFSGTAYNGSQTLSVTRETVPDNLIYTVAGGRLGPNYRANPFAPYDLDGNAMTKDRPMYDPEPPFRTIADLFNITLYDGVPVGGVGSDWLIEGFGRDFGPDPTEETGNPTLHVVPTAYDQAANDEATFGNTLNGPNALAVWGPIYQTDLRVTFGLNGITDTQVLRSWGIVNQSDNKDPASRYYKQQRFRLFSADDFKWISPYITTRSYVYRVESRGIVRVANGMNKIDISRDKLWMVDFGRDAYINLDTTGWENDPAETIDQRLLINGNAGEPYVVKAFEEVPTDGISLTRRNFSPLQM